MDPAGGEDGLGEERSLKGKALNGVIKNREGFSRFRNGEKTVGTRCAKARNTGEGDETTRFLRGSVRCFTEHRAKWGKGKVAPQTQAGARWPRAHSPLEEREESCEGRSTELGYSQKDGGERR